MEEPDWNGMLAEFLSRDSTTPISRDAVRRILEMDPERQPTGHLLPVDEATEKLEFLKELEIYWKDHFPSVTGQSPDQFKSLHPAVMEIMVLMDIYGPSVGIPRHDSAAAPICYTRVHQEERVPGVYLSLANRII